jgi:hypothetical protein
LPVPKIVIGQPIALRMAKFATQPWSSPPSWRGP